MRRALSLLGAVVLGLGVGCAGDRGPEGPPGPSGPLGPPGAPGDGGSSCAQSVSAAVAVSSPTNGSFFVAGERPVVTITFTNGCGQLVAPADLELAELFVYGPRAPTQTVTAYGLMNFAGGTFRAQSLQDPQYASDAGAPNMALAADNTVTYTLNPVTSETPGTYTVAVWMYTGDRVVQDFALADFQVGTATPEVFASGPADASTCRNCHTNRATGGKTYFAHIVPGSVPGSRFGDYALDSLPIASCKACYNNLGYSPNPILRKTHSVHRGEHMSAPGSAHPEYGYGRDLTLLLFTNVGFPVMPTGGTPGVALPATVAMEKDCTSCHVDDAWKTKPSQAACGTCHDNVYFAGALLPGGGVDPSATTAVIDPPTVLGFPSGTNGCTNDPSCSGLSIIATCNTTTKNCELTSHAKQTDDAQCATCHGPDNGVSPIADRHGISPFNAPISLEGYTFKNVTVTGGTGPGGSFKVGDALTLKFQLFDNQATPAPVADLTTNGAWAGTFLVAGPTSNPQRVFGAGSGGLSMKNAGQGTLTYDAPSQTYTYVPATTWPASSLAPINNPAAGTQPNPVGNYAVWFYWAKTTSGVRDAVDAQVAVAFGVNQKASGRQVVTQAACGACHGMTASGFPHLALHGGQRKNGETCSTCHSENAFDRVVGSTGVACTVNLDCPGFVGHWEACVPGGPGSVCTVTVDPTPGIVVDYQQLVHDIHFARLRENYKERNNIGLPPSIAPATLNYLGFNNSLLDFQEILAPLDVRSCTNCHQSTNAACSDSSPCGYGQTCTSGQCVNTAWQNATARACITCHDSAEAAAHAAQNTSGGGVESCPLCHDPDAIVPVAAAHNITSPYVPPYPREKE